LTAASAAVTTLCLTEMKKLKKIMRAIGLLLLILMAFTGIGFMGALFHSRERYRDKEVRIEMVDKKNRADEKQMDEIQVKE
jgi:hypothetical protein